LKSALITFSNAKEIAMPR